MVDFYVAQYFECRVAEIWSEEDFVFVKFGNGVNVTLNDLKEITALMITTQEDNQVMILTDLRGMKNITKAARDFGTSHNSKFKDQIAANALLVGNPISTIIGNFVLRVNRPPFPTKLFTNSADAEEWLNKFKPKTGRIGLH